MPVLLPPCPSSARPMLRTRNAQCAARETHRVVRCTVEVKRSGVRSSAVVGVQVHPPPHSRYTRPISTSYEVSMLTLTATVPSVPSRGRCSPVVSSSSSTVSPALIESKPLFPNLIDVFAESSSRAKGPISAGAEAPAGCPRRALDYRGCEALERVRARLRCRLCNLPTCTSYNSGGSPGGRQRCRRGAKPLASCVGPRPPTLGSDYRA
eukprot:scaffold12306_cov71-Phaeocystis_antarctica.AAC.2